MKKLLSVLCIFALLTAMLAGCSDGTDPAAGGDPSQPSGNTTDPSAETNPEDTASQDPEQQPAAGPADVRVMALKGPTAMGMVQFMSEADAGNLTDNNYSFSIVASADEVTPKLAQGEVDIAAVPANLASVLYNNTEGSVEVLAINTLGVIYIVESGDTVTSVEDLRGKTIYASGKGSTPEYALNYILSENGIDPASDVTIEWKSEHAECLSALMADTLDIP